MDEQMMMVDEGRWKVDEDKCIVNGGQMEGKWMVNGEQMVDGQLEGWMLDEYWIDECRMDGLLMVESEWWMGGWMDVGGWM